ncbi:UbiA family prenyltransferase [Chitinophaga pendula]|uniref:UbiA family prenyltransferase n=1 Tax=Chitinophaga TaxID=79328 RepID=UPI000BB0C6DA|nr:MULTISPECIES: UbiA family prenyltransferase [Chitinophaga]ASZ12254.1 hypothetical protein CK934_15435 [Chitinophaga sp. MD30]UCJ10161.1 UbiA family prenyltransferase [Chitinophaga pendula]
MSQSIRTPWLYYLQREVQLTWLFIYRDLSTTLLPGLVLVLLSWQDSGRSLALLPLYLCGTLLHMGLSLYTFCLSNQVHSVEEDRLNKPDRPLPSGLICVRGMYRRQVVGNLLYLLVGVVLGVLWFTIAWQVITYCLNNMGWSQHWATKNLLGMSLGAFVLDCAQWQIVQRLSSPVWLYIATFCIWQGISFQVQDLRDQEGDRLLHRRTLPIVVGDPAARLMLGIHFCLFSPLLFLLVMYTNASLHELSGSVTGMCILVAELLLNWLVAFRIWWYRHPAADHKTYQVFTWLACFNLLIIAFI